MTIEQYKKKYIAENQAAVNKQKETLTNTANAQIANFQESANASLDYIAEQGKTAETEAYADYENIVNTLNVQKLINERKLAESMGNAGSTDSGLNRTQRTAIQLSHSNAVSKEQITRQKTVDSIADWVRNKSTEVQLELKQNESSIKNALETNLAQIDADFDAAATEWAGEQRKADIAAENARIQAQQARTNAIISARNSILNTITKGELSEAQIGAYLSNHLAAYPEDKDWVNSIASNADDYVDPYYGDPRSKLNSTTQTKFLTSWKNEGSTEKNKSSLLNYLQNYRPSEALKAPTEEVIEKLVQNGAKTDADELNKWITAYSNNYGDETGGTKRLYDLMQMNSFKDNFVYNANTGKIESKTKNYLHGQTHRKIISIQI